MSILYPVAASADEALGAPSHMAAREREARDLAGDAVEFVCEAVGPSFTSREAAAQVFSAALAQPWSALRPVSSGPKARAPVRPTLQDGRRWPDAQSRGDALWRLSVSYWRIGGSQPGPKDPARQLRRARDGGELDAKDLLALSRQPLRAITAQQPLDIGLFEIHRPEAPHSVMPDE